MNDEEVVEQQPTKWPQQASNATTKECNDSRRGFRPVQQNTNAVESSGVSMTSFTPYSSFTQQQQQQQEQASGSSFRPTTGFSSSQQQQQPELMSPKGGDSQDQQQQQQQDDATQKLLAHLNSTISSGSQVPHLVTPQQIYMAAAVAEEAKLLDARKQQILQDWQQQVNNSKVPPANGTTGGAAGTTQQLWLDQKSDLAQWMERQQQLQHQLQQQQQQQLSKNVNPNDPSSASSVLPHHSTTAHLLPGTQAQQQQIAALQQAVVQQQQHQQQQIVQNGDLRLKTQSELQSAAETNSAAVQQHLVLGHGTSSGPSAFRQTQQCQFMLDRISEAQKDLATAAARASGTAGTSGFSVPSTSNSSFVAPLPRNYATAGKDEPPAASTTTFPIRDDDVAAESKLVISDTEISDETNSSGDRTREERQLHLGTGTGSGIVGMSTRATEDAVIRVVDDDDVDPAEKLSSDEQPRMKSILDFVDGEMEVDVEQKDADDTTDSNEKRLADEGVAALEKGSVIDESGKRFLVNNIESSEILASRTVTPLEQTRFAAMRIEERILNEKLNPSITSVTTATTAGSVVSSISSPQRSTPQSVPPALSPRSDSIPSTPSSSTFCRAPGLGPISTPDTQAGTQLPLVCNICGFSCNSKFHYNSHMNTHGDHQCTMCDYTSRTEGRLKKHMRDSHTVEEQLAAGLDLEQASTSSTSASASGTPVTRLNTTPVDGINLSTSMASVLEAANLAAAAQAAAAASGASSSSGTSGPVTSAPSDSGSGLSLPSGSGTPPPSDMASLSSSAGAGPSGLAPSALDQIRAFTENPSVLPDLSSANLATALISQGLLGPQAFQDSIKSNSSDEPSTSSLNGGDKPRQCSSKPKTYKCKQCCHISTSKEEQWAHARTHIPVEKQLGCTRCGFVTEYKHHLEYHLRNHMGSKPFHCKKCAYSCVNKSMLNSHMKSHTNIYQFRCRDCTYATKYCHSLKLHLRKYNHNRATDGTDSATVVVGGNATAGPSGLSNGSVPSVPDSTDASLRRLSESLTAAAAASADGSSSPESSLPTTSNIAQEISAALGITPMVTTNSLNLASHFLFRQQHQIEQVEMLLRLKNLAGLNAGTVLGISLHCPVCSYEAINQEDSLRHQIGHLLGPNGDNPLLSLYSTFGIPPPGAPPPAPAPAPFESNGGTDDNMNKPVVVQPDDEMDSSKVEIDDSMDGVEEKPMSSNTTDSEDHLMSDVSGESQDSPASGKSSTDEGSSSAEQGSDKGERRRKAGLKLNEIAARLHEKNSPENPNLNEIVNENKCEELSSRMKEEMLSDGMGENSLGVASSSQGVPLGVPPAAAPQPMPPTAPLAPQPRMVPPIGIHNDLASLNSLNIFQQACIAHMQDLEHKLHALEMWRFSCAHCKMAFQDEPLYHIHMGYHGYENPFKCNRCGQACADFLTFNLHLLQAKH